MSPSFTIRLFLLVFVIASSTRIEAANLSELPAAVVDQPPDQPSAPNLAQQPYFDLDAHLDQDSYFMTDSGQWRWHLLPNDLIYKSYLAGVKESRLGTKVFRTRHDDWMWGATLGGRVGMLRYGDDDPVLPQGIQLDVEGAAQVRLDISNEVDVEATDYRAGIPLTFGRGRHQTKLAYYHMSSHLGDEFLLRDPNFPRLNWSRDAFVLGHSIYLTERWRVYGEVGYAFQTDITAPWEFQVGTEWAPMTPTGFRGAPFLAVNGHLRQEVDYSGNLSAEVGWSWMSDHNRRLLRIGFYYYNGKSNQYSFFDNFERQIGGGVWYDF